MFPSTLLLLLLWIAHYSSTQQAMDTQTEFSGWLDDATFFPAAKQLLHQQPFIFDDFFGNTDDAKAQGDQGFPDLVVPDVSDILAGNDWMDEKIDLTDFGLQDDWLALSGDVIPEDPASSFDCVIDPDFFLDGSMPLKIINSAQHDDIIGNSFSTTNVSASADAISPSVTSIVSETGLQLLSFPPISRSNSISSFPSPSSSDESNTSEVVGSTESDVSQRDHGDIIFIEVLPSLDLDLGNSITQSSDAGKVKGNSRKYRKAQPYDSSRQKGQTKRERKKVQNKEAAARYRTKKRDQGKVLDNEVALLEAEQEKLHEKHDQLKNEITYLKSLMKEMFKARGMLK